MYVRCAYFDGFVDADVRERFDKFFVEQAIPLISKFPNLRGVRLLRGDWFEEGAGSIYQTIEMTFDSKEDMEAALSSDARDVNKANTQKSGVMSLFKGRVYHINHRIDAKW